MDENSQGRRDYLLKLIAKLNTRGNYLKRISRIYSTIRLSFFIVEVIIFFSLFFLVSGTAAVISLAAFFAVFSVTAHYHSKLERSIKKLKIWTEIKAQHLARIDLDWTNIPSLNNTTQNLKENEIDLDLFGNESVFQLINTSTTKKSKIMLREWLNSSSHDINKINKRQELVKELIPRTNFRDKLTLYSILSSRTEFSGDGVKKLLKKSAAITPLVKFIFLSLSVLSFLNILLLCLFLWNIVPAYWVISLTVYLLLFYYFIRDTERIFDEAEYISDELGKIKGVLRFLEKYQYKKGSKLLEMCRPFITDKERPSFLINKMKNTVELLRMREANPFVWNMMRMIFPVDIYFRLRLKKQKSLIEDKFDTWMNIWYKLESLCSLANFAYLNPEYTFPRIVNNEVNKIVFCGRQLGHPLISNKNKVCNDFSFNPDGEVALITGSNMSGKSTFIRTLGVNISLAYAGSVVNADYLEVSLFDLFSCIKVNDSLQESISFFYAEVKRLKALLDEIDKSQYPVLFLIDEIFRGTNNIERFKGSSMYIKKLVGTNAVGAVATHDLELVKLSGESVKVNIYHFKEEIINGEMVFDYKINPGPCPTTNALKIMKLAGLPVEEC